MKPIKNLRALSTKRLYEILDELENEKPDIDLAVENKDMYALHYIFFIDRFRSDIFKELNRRGVLK